MSKASGSEDEPLVPDDFDDDFYKELCDKIPEVTIWNYVSKTYVISILFIGHQSSAAKGYSQQCG